ncbi:AT-hook motif nuclear-localized protein 28-like [Phoenix dactylifera]|uniref:AT-hook motif nuclear-localized protein 28-like n=1 Tax=Phoenix dactylifera TaxID=42345 RepID=A0A8B7BNF6_PHODC|nr:AT-hook motif nuclear-localized protein 28-like [Phoenix dactylifera]
MAEYVRPTNSMMALSQPCDVPASDDDDDSSRRSAGERGRSTAGGGGGREPSSGSAGKKPRGRPPGSKNKPKPPVVITRESETAMRPMVLEIAAGCDVLESVAAFARSRRMGISVLSGSGVVANVPLRHPTTNPPVMTLHGRYDILSLSGTVLPPPSAVTTAPAAPAQVNFSISLAGTQGHVIGGTVAGQMKAAGPVVLVAASFANPEFHRLPLAAPAEDEETAAAKEDDAKPAGVEAAVPVYGLAGGSLPLTGPLTHRDMVLWAQPSSSRASHPPPPHY